MSIIRPISRLWNLVRLEKKEIGSIYFYAILSGLIQLTVPIGVQAIISFVLGASMVTSIVVLITLIVLGVLVVGIMQINQMKIIEKIQQNIFVKYAFDFAEKIPRFDLKKMDNIYLPEIINRFFDTNSLQKGISKLLLDIPTAMIQVIFGLLLLSFYHPIFILFGILLVAVLWIILYFTSFKGLATSLRESSYKYAVVGWLEEMARVITSFKFSHGTHLNLKKTDEKVSGYLMARTAHFKILLWQYRTLVAFKVIITTAMLTVGTYLLVHQQLNIGQFIAAEIVILTVISAVEKLIGSLENIYDVITALEKIEAVSEQSLEHDGTTPLLNAENGMEIEVENLTFEYIKDKPIIEEVDFKIPANAKVAVMGAARSSKSSLLKLLSGSYHDFKGSILINKIPIGNYQLKSLRQHTGLLLSKQDIFLGTVYENIAMGKDNVDNAKIIALATQLKFNDFLKSLNNSLDTALLPNGNQLSESVVQKILLLRALIDSPALLLLEKPFQGLSNEIVNILQDYLLNKIPNTTCFITTNDYVFASKCDYIIELKNGILVNFKKN
jgi:ATP-binding cassette, subfamily B, bacterial